MAEREREGQRDRETERQTDRQTDGGREGEREGERRWYFSLLLFRSCYQNHLGKQKKVKVVI